jgi:hypothetical protein
MPSIPYDATRTSLYHPGAADDFFSWGVPQNDAALCAEMSRLAYVKEETRLAGHLQRAGYNLVAALGYGEPGNQAFITSRADVTLVAFRGTEPEDPSDLFTDAQFILSDWCGPSGQRLGMVHQGFAQAAQDMQLFARIKAHLDALPPAAPVLLTGHSLGAALATLMASWVPSAQLYTYGSPRVGDAAFAQSVRNAVAVRVVNCCDLATRAPPEAVFGYAHAGKLAYIDRSGRWLDSPDKRTIADDRAEATARYFVQHAFLRGTVNVREFADHAPINYVSGAMGLRAPDAG